MSMGANDRGRGKTRFWLSGQSVSRPNISAIFVVWAVRRADGAVQSGPDGLHEGDDPEDLDHSLDVVDKI